MRVKFASSGTTAGATAVPAVKKVDSKHQLFFADRRDVAVREFTVQ